jgi:hypothetical protein
MPVSRFLSATVLVGSTILVSGCLDQSGGQPQHDWKLQEVNGSPAMINQETGSLYAFDDGHLIEIPRLSQDDLGAKELDISYLISLPMNLESSLKYSDGRLKMHASVDPEVDTDKEVEIFQQPTEQGLEAVQRLSVILDNEDEEYSRVSLTLHDAMGIHITSIPLERIDAQSMVDREGNITGLSFNITERMSPPDYAAIDSIQYSWSNK